MLGLNEVIYVQSNVSRQFYFYSGIPTVLWTKLTRTQTCLMSWGLLLPDCYKKALTRYLACNDIKTTFFPNLDQQLIDDN